MNGFNESQSTTNIFQPMCRVICVCVSVYVFTCDAISWNTMFNNNEAQHAMVVAVAVAAAVEHYGICCC